MEVVLVACAVLLDVNAYSGPCHPTTPTTYYIVVVLLVSRIRGAGYVVQYGYSKNTRTTCEACEASTNSVLLLLIGLIR